MAINQDIRLKFSSDQSNAIAGIGQLQGKMRSLAAEASGDIQNKISSIFSVVAIEEAIRRTGEWANALQKSSRIVGLTNEEMQGTVRIFDKAGVGSEKIETYFDKIANAMDKAKEGVKGYSAELRKLGVTPDMYNKPPGVAFGTAMAHAEGNSGAIGSIFGTKSLLDIKAISNEMKGTSISGYAEQHKEEIVSNDDVNSMAQNWESIVQDLISIGNKLKPLLGIVLGIVDGILKMVNGIVGNIKFLGGTIFQTMGLGIKQKEGESYGQAYMRTMRENGDEMRGRYASKGTLKALGGAVTLGLRQDKGQMFEAFHNPYAEQIENKKHNKIGGKMDEAAAREMEGLADFSVTAATFGVGGVAKLTGAGIKGVGIGAEAITGAKVAGTGAKIAEGIDISKTAIGEGGLGILTRKSIEKYYKSKLNRMPSADEIKTSSQNLKDLGVGHVTEENFDELMHIGQESNNLVRDTRMAALRMKIMKGARAVNIAGSIGEFGMYGATGKKDVKPYEGPDKNGWGNSAASRTNIFGGGPNIKIGGLLGVDQLAAGIADSISKNTGRTADATEQMNKKMDKIISPMDKIISPMGQSGPISDMIMRTGGY